ncbi:SGNH/GDSL hydrolase family protein [Stigmatella erecta]|uniref:Phospholipase/lecithinase/hemolysin n=1 Tax=Stigmatella erecta TaxID=83460 RepID=A0A1I0IGM0_9BACT|nr:SGNH/GDSL hydrolase family protein [Stigmatella erecta]SET96081.1 Phospholipase/lecithinase/hemolysin [Stigmatella erecta]
MKHTLLCLALCLAALGPLRASAQTHIVAFGDSLSDNGNNGTATSGPTTNPSSQISGVWVKQLATRLGLPLLASDSGGTNYARGGAVTSGMTTQVNQYLAAHPSASSTALYTLWGGGNDINYKAQANPFDSAAIKAAATTAVSNIESQIRKLAKAGAKHILWVNMPPLDKTPVALSIPAGLGSTVLRPPTLHFNTLWAQSLTRLRQEFPGITLTGMDVYAFFNTLIASPSSYGLVNVTGTSKGKAVNPDTYLFWDELHPTSYSHRLLSTFAYGLLDNAYGLQAVEPGFGGDVLLEQAAP